MRQARLLFGISIFWLALSALTDGLNSLILPHRLLALPDSSQASTLGLLTFAGLLAAMLIQPAAGIFSDRTRQRWGRRGVLAMGLALILPGLALLAAGTGLAITALGTLLVLVAASIAQAAQQGFIPDLVPAAQRGIASGWKGFMDIGGAMLSFVLLGQLLGSGQSGLALAAVAGLLLAAFLLTTLLVREPKALHMNGKSHRRPTLADVFRLDLLKHRRFAWLVAARFFFLLGVYAVGRFLLFFVSDRLGLDPAAASQQAGQLLAGLALVTVIASPLAGWAADRLGRVPLMLFGAAASAAGVLLLASARSAGQILLFGALMSLGSAAFAGANWAMTADVVPPAEAGRYFGLANFGTAGAAAFAGLFGLLVDGANRLSPGAGFPALFVSAAAAFAASALCLRGLASRRVGESVLQERKDSPLMNTDEEKR